MPSGPRNRSCSWLLLLLLAASCDGTAPIPAQQADSEKPSWWPDPPKRDGLAWPPPRPDDLDPELPWPPILEIGEDLGFWIDLYGEDVDPQDDPRLNERNQVGSGPFTRNFRQIFDGDDRTVPECGWFMLQILDTRGVQTCDPFPAAAARQACMRPFNAAIARARCQVLCQKNDECRQGEIFTPPIHGGWSCVPGTETPPGDLVNCDAYYVCSCSEDEPSISPVQ